MWWCLLVEQHVEGFAYMPWNMDTRVVFRRGTEGTKQQSGMERFQKLWNSVSRNARLTECGNVEWKELVPLNGTFGRQWNPLITPKPTKEMIPCLVDTHLRFLDQKEYKSQYKQNMFTNQNTFTSYPNVLEKFHLIPVDSPDQTLGSYMYIFVFVMYDR